MIVQLSVLITVWCWTMCRSFAEERMCLSAFPLNVSTEQCLSHFRLIYRFNLAILDAIDGLLPEISSSNWLVSRFTKHTKFTHVKMKEGRYIGCQMDHISISSIWRNALVGTTTSAEKWLLSEYRCEYHTPVVNVIAVFVHLPFTRLSWFWNLISVNETNNVHFATKLIISSQKTNYYDVTSVCFSGRNAVITVKMT